MSAGRRHFLKIMSGFAIGLGLNRMSVNAVQAHSVTNNPQITNFGSGFSTETLSSVRSNNLSGPVDFSKISLSSFTGSLISMLIWVVGIIVLLQIVHGALSYQSSRNGALTAQQASSTIQAALAGLVAVVIINAIINAVLFIYY